MQVVFFAAAYALFASVAAAYETRFTGKRYASGTKPARHIRPIFVEESIHSPQLVSNYQQVTKKYALSCSLSCTLVILRPLTRVTRLRRSCFTERGAPLETWIDVNISICHCRQRLMLNDIGGARTRTV